MTLTTGPSVDGKGISIVCAGAPYGASCQTKLIPLSVFRRTRSSAVGFTLLELVLVLVIICMVLTLAAPSLRGFFSSRQTADAAAQIVALTRLARSQAIAEGRTYRLNLDVQDQTYWLSAQEGGVFVNLRSEFGRVFMLPKGTTATWEETVEAGLPATHIAGLPVAGETGAGSYVPFYPDGRTEAVRIRLSGRQGECFDIVCSSPAEQFRVVLPAKGGP